MTPSLIYFLVTIIVSATVAVLIYRFCKDRSPHRFDLLSGFAFGLILAGLFFSKYRVAGYGLMGLGFIIAIIDLIS
jgi:high-affinity Fe2+/Pb2+ permease